MSAPTTSSVAQRDRIVLNNVDWSEYTRLLRHFADRPRYRLTYDCGVLEIMSPSFEHDSDTELFGRFVVVLTEEMDLPLHAGGSTTLRRRRKQKGIEPDRCWWIANEPRVRGKRTLDLRRDPPPDLAVETDVTNSSLDRLIIYLQLRIPEVWRLEGQTLTFHVLSPDSKRYVEANQSRSFPCVTPADLLRFLALAAARDDNAIVREFRAWVRQQIASPPTP